MVTSDFRSTTAQPDDLIARSGMYPVISWSSVIGGAFAATAISLVMISLGSGIGFSSLSPMGDGHPSAVSFTVKAAVWLIIIQWLASALGGYLAGRLRTKWAGIHNDEVFFRDTANGFLAWAVATVFTAGVLVTSVFSAANGGAHMAAGAMAHGPAPMEGHGGPEANGPHAYFVDGLFRSDHAGASASQDIRAEAGRIIINDTRNDNFTDGDKTYLAQLVSSQTGLAQVDAAKRVDDIIAQIHEAEGKVRQAAETARKSAAQFSFFTFFSLLVGAFIASVAGALGGKRRDEY